MQNKGFSGLLAFGAMLLIAVNCYASGQSLSDDFRITYSGGTEGYPSIILDNEGDVVLSWAGNYRGSGWFGSRFYTKLDRDGNILIHNTLIPLNGLQGPASLAVDSRNNIHFAYHSSENIFHKLIDPFGNIESGAQMNKTTGFNTDIPQLIVGPSDQLFLLYQDEQNDPIQGDSNRRRDIFYQKLIWSNYYLSYLLGPVELTVEEGEGPPNVGYVNNLGNAVLDGDGNINVVWSDWRNYHNYKSNEIYFKKIDVDGNPIVEELKITAQDGFNSNSPRLALDSYGVIHVFWIDGRDGGSSLFYKKLNNDGNVLLEDTKLALLTNNVRTFSYSIDHFDNIHIFYEGKSGLDYSVNYLKLDPGGNKIEEFRVSSLEKSSLFNWYVPSVAVDLMGRVHFIWADDRNGNWEIYYKFADFEDRNPPVITLLGASTVEVEAGSVYIDAGATAFDDVDGDLSGEIIVNNTVDTSVLGVHEVRYSLDDFSGNGADEVVRYVNVVDTISPYVEIDVDKRILWPSNRRLVPVYIDKYLSDEGSGVFSTQLFLNDEYGIYSGEIQSDSDFISLESWRDGRDKDGRLYTLTIVVEDYAGNVSEDSVNILVPHDMRKIKR